MLVHETHAAGRPTLTFRLMGLPPREQMLFKSFIRLIDHLTHQHWEHADTDVSDLVVAGDGVEVSAQAPVLRLGAQPADAPHHLTLPLHADQLEREMNLLGDLVLLGRRSTPANGQSPNGALAGAAAGGVVGITVTRPSFADTQPLRLLRWPAPSVLRGTERLRLATMMSVRTFTPRSLQEQSGVSGAALADFLADLASGDLLEILDMGAGPAPRDSRPAPLVAEQTARSLLARIRSRLSLLHSQS